MSEEGVIIRAMSGFYTVRCAEKTVECRARGRFRLDGSSPLVGDRVLIEALPDGTGTVRQLLPRSRAFGRPAVANVDCLIMLLCAALPVTDPYLADRVTVRCERCGCGVVLVVNKCDLDPGEELFSLYRKTGYPLLRTSAVTGEGLPALRALIRGKTCCLTGNSGVGKSSLLNALDPALALETGDVSRRLGRGRHTTRHVELFELPDGTLIADTPGFSAFDNDNELPPRPRELPGLFPDFAPYLGKCRFDDCAHRSEPDCAVREAAQSGLISPSRYASYLRMYEEADSLRDWERHDPPGK